MDRWTIAWLAWLAAFILLEGRALTNKTKDDTLSAHVWQWFGIRGKGPFVKTRRLALLAFMAWLSVHFVTGGYV